MVELIPVVVVCAFMVIMQTGSDFICWKMKHWVSFFLCFSVFKNIDLSIHSEYLCHVLRYQYFITTHGRNCSRNTFTWMLLFPTHTTRALLYLCFNNSLKFYGLNRVSVFLVWLLSFRHGCPVSCCVHMLKYFFVPIFFIFVCFFFHKTVSEHVCSTDTSVVIAPD